MARLVITAEVEDGAAWETAFRTHVDLFREQTSKNMHFAVDGNHVALYSEVGDLDKFREIFDSPATAEAMSVDGVKKETVRLYVLDKELPL